MSVFRLPAYHRPSRQKLLRILTHVAVWLAVVCLLLLVLPPPPQAPLWYLLVPMLLLAGLFYLNYWVLIPQLLAQRRFGQYFTVLMLVGLVFGIPLTLRRMGVLPPVGQGPNAPSNPELKVALIIGLVWLVSSALRITGDWLASEQLRQEQHSSRLVSELAFLKSQVNPHFLFNTLNNVYSLAELKSDNAPVAILKLSHLMRYMLYEAAAPRVPLLREVEYLHNYIDLQRLRLDPGRVPITFDTEGTLVGYLIEPMLLIPFVENAFKHGISFQQPSRIAISLHATATKLRFVVCNQQVALPAPGGDEPPGGVGLANVAQRLRLLYPGRHTLVLDQSSEEFVVTLTLQLVHAPVLDS